MKKTLITTAFVLSMAASPALNAATATVLATVGGAPTGVSYLNFDDLTDGATGVLNTAGPNGSATVTISPNAHVAVGSLLHQWAAPFVSGNNMDNFDAPVTQDIPGEDETPYITSGRLEGDDDGSVKIDFGSDQQYMGLLWGSVDDFNTLAFYDSGDNLLDTVTGADVVGSPSGDQGVNGTLYVNINVDAPFRYVVITSERFAFEFDNVAYNQRPIEETPEAGSLLGIFGAAAGLMAFARRSVKR